MILIFNMGRCEIKWASRCPLPWHRILSWMLILIAAPIGRDKNQMPAYRCSAKIWLVMCIFRPKSALRGMCNTVFGSASLNLMLGRRQPCKKNSKLTSVSFGQSCFISLRFKGSLFNSIGRYRDFSLRLSAVTAKFGFSWGAAMITFDKWSYCRLMTILNFCCAASHGEVAAIQNWQCMATSLGQGAHGEKWTCEKRFIAVRNSWGSSFARKAWSGAYISDNTDFTSR